MLEVRDGMRCDQSMFIFQPKKMSPHPAGTSACTSWADTRVMAMTAMMTEQIAMMKNWARSVITTLIMPPRRT